MPEVVGTLKPPRLAAPPSSPALGQMYYDTVTNGLYFWDGVTWVSTRSSAGTIYDSDPIGAVKGWSRKVVPTNWKLADGATYTKAAFPQGWDCAKAEADAGNPLWTYTATDFTVPNLTDKFILAPGTIGTLGQTGGERNHILIPAETAMKAHNHGGATVGGGAPDHLHTGIHYHQAGATIDLSRGTISP